MLRPAAEVRQAIENERAPATVRLTIPPREILRRRVAGECEDPAPHLGAASRGLVGRAINIVEAPRRHRGPSAEKPGPPERV
jgi:hypothetical protein